MAYYWYQSDPQLYQLEVAAMRKYFPSFQLINFKMVLEGYIGEEKFSLLVKVEWCGI